MLLVWPGFVISRVTGGAVRLIGRKGPLNLLAVGLVTRCAGKATTVVTRIGGRHVTEYRRREGHGRMAFVTLSIGDEVIDILAGCLCSVVAA